MFTANVTPLRRQTASVCVCVFRLQLADDVEPLGRSVDDVGLDCCHGNRAGCADADGKQLMHKPPANPSVSVCSPQSYDCRVWPF